MQTTQEHVRGIRKSRQRQAAAGLGWFSLALGTGLVLAPRPIAEAIGVRATRRGRNVMRAVGFREIAGGVGIFSSGPGAPWLWARVAGDGIDMALLGKALGLGRTDRSKVRLALASVAGIGWLDAAA